MSADDRTLYHTMPVAELQLLHGAFVLDLRSHASRTAPTEDDLHGLRDLLNFALTRLDWIAQELAARAQA
jgi:hypothetical protein